MVIFFVVCLAVFSCGTTAGYGKYYVNGKEVTEAEYRQMSNGFSPFSSTFSGSSFGNFGSSSFGGSSFSNNQEPLSRKPSLTGNSIFGHGDSHSTATYLLNGRPVTKEEFEAASAKSPLGGSQFSYQPSLQSSQQRPHSALQPGGSAPQSSAPKTPQGAAILTPAVKQKIVDLHNKYREDVATGKVPGQPKATQMTKLAWDEELSKVASAYAARCQFKHSDTEEYCGISGLPSVGENMGTGTLMIGEEMLTEEEIAEKILDHISHWFEEHPDYQYHSLSCRPGKMCGHYTQVVADKTDVVGCGVAMCNNGVAGFTGGRAYLVVCNYGPHGNVYGQKPYAINDGPCPVRHPIRQGAFCVGEQKEKINCVDTSVGCARWKAEGKCKMCHNPYYDSVTSQCPKTCEVC